MRLLAHRRSVWCMVWVTVGLSFLMSLHTLRGAAASLRVRERRVTMSDFAALRPGMRIEWLSIQAARHPPRLIRFSIDQGITTELLVIVYDSGPWSAANIAAWRVLIGDTIAGGRPVWLVKTGSATVDWLGEFCVSPLAVCGTSMQTSEPASGIFMTNSPVTLQISRQGEVLALDWGAYARRATDATEPR